MKIRLFRLMGLLWFISGIIYLLPLSIFTQSSDLNSGPSKTSENQSTSPTPVSFRANLQPGTWIKYHIKRSQVDNEDFKIIWESNLMISVTSEVKQASTSLQHNEKKDTNQQSLSYYEVEIVASYGTFPENTHIIKFRITSKGTPLLDKIVFKHPYLHPVEIDLALWSEKLGISREDLFREMTENFLVVPLVPPETPPQADQIDIIQPSLEKTKPATDEKPVRRTINCQRYLIENPSDSTITKIWFSPEVLPFPSVAKMLIIEEKFQTQVMLVDYGTTGGESLIKEKPIKLDFKKGR